MLMLILSYYNPTIPIIIKCVLYIGNPSVIISTTEKVSEK